MSKLRIEKLKQGISSNNDVLVFRNDLGTFQGQSNVVLNTITLGGNTVNSSVYTGTSLNANSTTYFGGQLSTYYANATVPGTAYSNAVTYAGTIAGTAYANAVIFANTIANTAFTNAVSVAASDATTKAATAYSNATSYADTKAAAAYSNAISYSGNAALAYANAIAYSGNAALAYANATAYADTKAATAFSNAASRADAAYTNAVAYAASNTYVNSTFAKLSGATFSANISLTGGTITTAPSGQYDIVNRLYVDSIAAGINFHTAARLSTTVSFDVTTATYYNGTAGVGATITDNSPYIALSLDGVTAAYNDRILFKNASNTAWNGIYYVSNTGSGSYPWILTRATDYDTVGVGVNEIAQGDLIYVTAGSTLAGTSWVEQQTVTTIGTDPITFAQFSSKTLYALSSGSGLYYSVGSAFDGTAASTLAVNTSYIATLSANNTTYLNGQAASFYAANSQLASYVLLTGTSAVSISNTLATGNTTVTGFINVSTSVAAANINTSGTVSADIITVSNVAQTQTNLQVDPAGSAFLNAIIYG